MSIVNDCFYGSGLWSHGNFKTGISLTLPIYFPLQSYIWEEIQIVSEAVNFHIQIINVWLRGNIDT